MAARNFVKVFARFHTKIAKFKCFKLTFVQYFVTFYKLRFIDFFNVIFLVIMQFVQKKQIMEPWNCVLWRPVNVGICTCAYEYIIFYDYKIK